MDEKEFLKLFLEWQRTAPDESLIDFIEREHPDRLLAFAETVVRQRAGELAWTVYQASQQIREASGSDLKVLDDELISQVSGLSENETWYGIRKLEELGLARAK